MLNVRLTRLFLLALFVSIAALRAQDNYMPLCAKEGLAKASLQTVQGLDAKLATRSPDGANSPSWQVSFTKKGPERRFIPLEIALPTVTPSYKALEMTLSSTAESNLTLRPAIMFYDKNGNAWYRYGMPLVNDGQAQALRMNLSQLRRANFNKDGSKDMDWSGLSHLWLGLLADGEGAGQFALSNVGLTSRAYVATTPLLIPLRPIKAWSMAHDKAATQSSQMLKDGDQEVASVSFRFPLNRHMYVTPSMALPEAEYEAYKGLRLVYKATLPAGINGLLIMFHEGGGSFYSSIPVPATDGWQSIELPYDKFVMASWSKKTNGSDFEPARITRLTVGCHGTATGDNGEGEYAIQKIELIP
jgi:hypothetical protein